MIRSPATHPTNNRTTRRSLSRNLRASSWLQSKCIPENSPAIYGWEYSQANFTGPVRDGRHFLPSLTGLGTVPNREPSHKWLGYCQNHHAAEGDDGPVLKFSVM